VALGQKAALSALTWLSRVTIRRRTAPLPPLGEATYLTAVLRLDHPGLPASTYPGHYTYPAHTVHVTVANLDRAGRTLESALESLAARRLPAPTFRITGLGCSSDTVFLRCIHDRRFRQLRRAVRAAFGVGSPRAPLAWLFDRLSFANVVRFAGPARWARVGILPGSVRCTELEIVRTDRFLSDRGTIELAQLALDI
jgi:hypothetical protein